jgi:hypothetical protein
MKKRPGEDEEKERKKESDKKGSQDGLYASKPLAVGGHGQFTASSPEGPLSSRGDQSKRDFPCNQRVHC